MFRSYLTGPGGEQSSKRLFTLVLMMLWIIYFFANLFWGYVLRDTFEDQLFYMILFFYLGITLEGWKNVFKSAGPNKIENIEKKVEVNQ